MNENYLRFFCLFLLYGSTSSFKVYDWRRDFSDTGTTQEFAQVYEASQQILHSAVNTEDMGDVPVITFIDFNFSATKFEKGILAIRPLMSDGNQLCFVSRLKTKWEDALAILKSRHKMTVAVDDLDTVFLKSKLPANLDPTMVETLSDFCDVDREYIFYLKPTSSRSLSSYNHSIYVQTAFRRFQIGVDDDDVPTVFDFSGKTSLGSFSHKAST